MMLQPQLQNVSYPLRQQKSKIHLPHQPYIRAKMIMTSENVKLKKLTILMRHV